MIAIVALSFLSNNISVFTLCKVGYKREEYPYFASFISGV